MIKAPQENGAIIKERCRVGGSKFRIPGEINFVFHWASKVQGGFGIEFDGIYLYRFKDGKRVERSGKRDMLKIMSRLGATPQLE